MFKDRVIAGAIIGLLADVIKLIINFIGYILNLTDAVFWQITATRFLEKKDLFKPVAYFIGGIADLTVTAGLGIVFVYLLHIVGRDFLWIKGIGYGMAVWVGIFGTLLGQTVQDKLPQTPTGIIVTIAAHFFFGLALAFFTWLLYRDKLD